MSPDEVDCLSNGGVMSKPLQLDSRDGKWDSVYLESWAWFGTDSRRRVETLARDH